MLRNSVTTSLAYPDSARAARRVSSVVVDIFRTGPNGSDRLEGIKFGPDWVNFFRNHF